MRLTVKPRTILERAIDEGLRHGLAHAYKYDDTPRGQDDWREADLDALTREIWLAIDEVCDVADPPME